MLTYFRLHCLLYVFSRGGGGVNVFQANLLKKALVAALVVMAHTIATSQVHELHAFTYVWFSRSFF